MKVKIIGVPSDFGADRRGVDMGPSAIRYADLQGRLEQIGIHVEDAGNIAVANPESRNILDHRLKYLPEVITTAENLAREVGSAIAKGYTPLVLGGDHSIALGTVAGMSEAMGRIGLIWMDAHGDFNTDVSSPSGNIHGMILAASLGIGHSALTDILGFSPKLEAFNTVVVGARDLDPGEVELIKRAGIHVFTMSHIDRYGMKNVMKEAIALASDKVEGVHLSFDMDVLDPGVAPGVGTPVKGGITYREGALAMEMLADAKVLSSLEFVEVNPILDVSNETAKLTVGLIASALGETIL